jgi:hypothetical protein
MPQHYIFSEMREQKKKEMQGQERRILHDPGNRLSVVLSL